MKFLLIDGNSIINRAFFGIKTLTTKDGRYTNAIYGFFNIFLKQLALHQPQYVAVAFDLPGGTFRNSMYDGYKANRKGMPPELAEQLPVVKQLLELLGYKVVTCQNFEADDILGTLSRAGAAQGAQCLVLTGDRDSLQLVDEDVHVLYAGIRMGQSETVEMDAAAVQQKYGVTPDRLIDVKALMGDSSDNIPGVSGIGEKTACTLIANFGSLDGVYENLEDKRITPSVRRHLTEEKEMAYLCRKLVTIDRDAPVQRELSAYEVGEPNREEAARLLAALEMHSIAQRLELGAVQPAKQAEQGSEPLKEAAVVSAEELAGKDIWLFAGEEGWFAASGAQTAALTEQELAALSKSGGAVCCSDSKALQRVLLANGVQDFLPAFDIQLAGYLLNPSASGYAAATLAAEYGVQPAVKTEPEVLGLLQPLAETLQKKLEETGMLRLLTEVEIPLAKVLAAMELRGFLVDKAGIAAFGRELTALADDELLEVYRIAGHSFNVNSPKQLGEVLFEEQGLPHGRKTRNGYSTAKDVLESLQRDYPIVDHVLRYRSYHKLNTTYVEGLLAAVDAEGRVHTEFRQTETRTGRISSVNPNLQNIPIRTELGSRMRKFFVAPQGHLLLDADYSQIELRVLASMSGDTAMVTAFREGHDVHTEAAAEIFRLPREQVTPELRRRAKAVNFGIVYGIGAYSLSQDIEVTVKEAADYIERYMRSYPNISSYLEDTVQQAQRDGFVTTLYGRRRYIPELANSNKQVQALGRRLAMNTPVQGSAADIIKIAMVRVHERLQRELPEAHLVLQVHDELIVECSEQDADRAAAILQQEMESACQLAAPLVADVHRGQNWYDAK